MQQQIRYSLCFKHCPLSSPESVDKIDIADSGKNRTCRAGEGGHGASVNCVHVGVGMGVTAALVT